MSFLNNNEDTIFDMLVATVSFIPLVGDAIGSGLTLANGFRKLLKNRNKADQIIEQIKIKIRCNGLNEEDIKSICFATQSALINRKEVISKVFGDESLLQGLKNEILIGSNNRKDAESEYKKYINDVINFISESEILAILLDCDQVVIENLNEIRHIMNELEMVKERINVLEEITDDHEKRIKTLEQNGTSNESNKHDNKSYLNNFTKELFLEKAGSKVTLKNMYIAPHIESTGDSAAKCIMNWFKNNRRQPCMLLYGAAGVGKSSLISKIIADANGKTDGKDKEFTISKDVIIVCTLRKLPKASITASDSEDLILKLFNGYSLDQLKTKLLVLDGLDELCVMDTSFKGSEFLSYISMLEDGFHVLVTSREADYYFKEPSGNKRIVIEHLKWTEKEIEKWCSKYCLHNPDKDEWRKAFISEYENLDDRDDRRTIFCTPIILYICGYSETLLSDHNSIGAIYKNAFINILCRKHQTGQSDISKLTTPERNSNLITWQYTKELAYQMYLIDSLDLVITDDKDNMLSKGIKNAKTMTIEFCRKNYGIEVNPDDLEIKRELALCPFTKENESGGITFAHKTVYEYFTAVKLYEDYIAKYNYEYFDDEESKDLNHAALEIIRSIITAFRYRMISDEVLYFLIKMNEKPFSGKTDDHSEKGKTFFFEKFVDTFIHGMNHNLATITEVPAAAVEYLYPPHDSNDFSYKNSLPLMHKSINTQISCAFTNAIRYITLEAVYTPPITLIDVYTHLATPPYTIITTNNNLKGFELGNLFNDYSLELDLSGWNFKGINLKSSFLVGVFLTSANLSYANLMKADLSYSDFMKANFTEADMTEAVFKEADFTEADLTKANLTKANLTKANLAKTTLTKANLSEANLLEADLTDAKLIGGNLAIAQLIEAKLTGAKLTDAYLAGTNLIGAILTDADLTDAYLVGADLTNADLTGADLTNADLTGAILTGANLSNITYNQQTVFPEGFTPI